MRCIVRVVPEPGFSVEPGEVKSTAPDVESTVVIKHDMTEPFSCDREVYDVYFRPADSSQRVC